MKLLKELIKIDSDNELPIYLQITNSFIHNIRLGRLRKGLRLPGSRELASLLQFNRMTIVAVYAELQSQGWITVQPRKGTFISETLPLLSPKKVAEQKSPFSFPETPIFSFIENKNSSFPSSEFSVPAKLIFNHGFPDPRIAPVEQLMRSIRRISRMKSQVKHLMYGNPQGTLLLRKTLAEFLSDTRGLPVTPDNILITNGAQMGIFLATSLLIQPQDQIIVGQPGYRGANRTFLHLGAVIHPVPVDEDGIDVDAVESICRQQMIKFVYVISHHHNPTTVTLSPERRIRLLELSQRYKFAIIEDDYDYDFHYASKPIMPIASMDRHGSVIYIGTLTKTLAPAIRIGFMVAPLRFIQNAVYLRRTIDMQGDSLLENGIAELYRDGTMSAHIKKAVKLYRDRRDHFCHLLATELKGQVSFEIPDGGMSVWTKFRGDLMQISKRANARGLVLGNGTEFNTPTVSHNAVRLGFASFNNQEQEQAIEILRDCL